MVQRLQMKKANVARRAMNNLPCMSSELSRLIGHKTDTRAHTYGFIRENSDGRKLRVKSAKHAFLGL